MRILFHSNAPHTPTGYGKQCALFAPMLAEDHEVFISANYGIEGAPQVWRGIPVLPGLGGTHGNEAIPGHVMAVFDGPREGLVLTLYDTPVFDPKIFQRLNVACWTPVDHTPPPPAVVAFFRESQAIPLCMSRFGQEELAEFEPLYVPHGIDVDIYKPTASNVRAEMGVPEDAFLVAMLAANKGRPSRKAFVQNLWAFKELAKRHDDVYLYLHTTLSAQYAGGEDISLLLSSLDVDEDLVKYPNQYGMMFNPLPDTKLAEILSTSNVLLNASMGEGFGVPVAEAAACGCPSIVTNASAMPEVAGRDAWVVEGEPFWTGQASWMKTPHAGEIAEALEECYGLPDDMRKQLALRLRTHAMQYAARHVYDNHMAPALADIEERFGDRQPLEVAA